MRKTREEEKIEKIKGIALLVQFNINILLDFLLAHST
jgi:hypothetical protein